MDRDKLHGSHKADMPNIGIFQTAHCLWAIPDFVIHGIDFFW
jgi:hypothetical protein